VPEDGINQADVDAARQEGIDSVVPEDGITQAHVDAALNTCPAPTTCPTTGDTPGWTNGYGYDCASYASRWCANGGARSGQEWTLGATYAFPENNCVVCVKSATATAAGLTSGVDEDEDTKLMKMKMKMKHDGPEAADTGGGGNDVPVSWASETVAVCAVLITIFLAMLVCVNVSHARLQRVDADDEDADDGGTYQGGVTSVASVSEL